VAKHGGDRKSKEFEDAQKRALKSAIEQARQNRAKVKKAAEDFRTLAPESQRAAVTDLWKETAYVTALRASDFAKTCGAREGDRLKDLISSAATAHDKAYPVKDALDAKEVLKLFGTLGRSVESIVKPKTPTITATVQPQPPLIEAPHVQEVSCPSPEDSQLSPVSSLPPLGAGWPDANKLNLSSSQSQSNTASRRKSSQTKKSV
jgi:hypothetical protein